MIEILSDEQIASLLAESKTLPEELNDLTPALRNIKLGHKEGQFEVEGSNGNDFRIIIRQSNFNFLDFSVILAFLPKTTNQVIRLRRYNGKSHEHTNRIERDRFYGFHIHTATHRYQLEAETEDGFAEPSIRFSDLSGAIQCLITDCGFIIPNQQKTRMF